MAPDSFDDLRFTRLEQVNSKRKKGGFGRPDKPEDPKAHAKQLLDQLAESANAQQGVAGFDPRLLVKLKVEGISPVGTSIMSRATVPQPPAHFLGYPARSPKTV